MHTELYFMVLAQPFFVIVQYTELYFMVLAQPFFVIVQHTKLYFMVLLYYYKESIIIMSL
jgi:hypothetical protein